MSKGSGLNIVMLLSNVMSFDAIVDKIQECCAEYKAEPSEENRMHLAMMCSMLMSKLAIADAGGVDAVMKEIDDMEKIKSVFNHTQNHS